MQNTVTHRVRNHTIAKQTKTKPIQQQHTIHTRQTNETTTSNTTHHIQTMHTKNKRQETNRRARTKQANDIDTQTNHNTSHNITT